MNGSRRLSVLATSLTLTLWTGFATAEEPMKRAGCPQHIAPWARCSFNQRYYGYYVGGGAWRHSGDARDPDEGTWGLDYSFRKQPGVLNWWHGRRLQDGGGQYEPDAHVNPFRTLLHAAQTRPE
jgi:hypothetical protein